MVRKTFLRRLMQRDQDPKNSYNSCSKLHASVPKKPVTLKTALLSWQPHVVGSGRVRGVKFTGCVQRHESGELEEKDGYKAIFDGDRYLFSTNEDAGEFIHEVKLGSLITFTVWGMAPTQARDFHYGSVIVVDGVNATKKGANLYFNATLIASVEPEKLYFVDSLPAVRFSTLSDTLSKLQFMPPCVQDSSSFFFEDMVMKVKADQPHFKPYLEFSVTVVDGSHRMAIGTTLRPAICEAYFEKYGAKSVMEKVTTAPESWDFTLVGVLTSFVSGSKQRLFVTQGFFFK